MSMQRFQEVHDTNTNRRRGVKLLPALCACFIVGIALIVSRAAMPTVSVIQDADATTISVKAANAFLESLDDKQRAKVLLSYDSAKKSQWSNLPVPMVARNGIRLGVLNKKQRAKAMKVLEAVLSKKGYQKVIDIMNADDKLIRDKVNRMEFGTEHFYLAIFGKPSPKKPWMVQFGGHHLGVNVTMVGKNAVLSPTHTGTQPIVFKRKGKDVRPLGPENDLAFQLVNQLDAKQKAKAIRGDRPRNLVLGPGKDNKTVKAEGIKGAALTKDQRGVLLKLIGAWVTMLPDSAAKRRMTEIESKLGETYFAWYGPTKNGSAVYYRIQGPNVVIEYAPQRGPGHIHTVIRNPLNDYAKRLTE